MIWTISYVLMFLGTLGLARSGAVSTSRLGQIGLWIALVGMALIAALDLGFAFFANTAEQCTQVRKLAQLFYAQLTASFSPFLRSN